MGRDGRLKREGGTFFTKTSVSCYAGSRIAMGRVRAGVPACAPHMKTPSKTHWRRVAELSLAAILLGLILFFDSPRSQETPARVADDRVEDAQPDAQSHLSKGVASISEQVQAFDRLPVLEQPGDEVVFAQLRNGPSPWKPVAEEKRPLLQVKKEVVRAPAEADQYYLPARPVMIGDIPLDLSSPESSARTVAALEAKSKKEKAAAIVWAQERGKPISGPGFSLMRVEDEVPIYYHTRNLTAAVSINVHKLWSSPYTVAGDEGWTAGVWDGGDPQRNHVEFGGKVRFRDPDGSGEEGGREHATHVAGTIVARGLRPSAIGMAPGAQAEVYDWDDDIAEMMDRSAKTRSDALVRGVPPAERALLVSNHSYGVNAGWYIDGDSEKWRYRVQDATSTSVGPRLGAYGAGSAVDGVCVAAPYYLPLWAAGNDRSENPAEGDEVEIQRDRAGNWTEETYSSSTHPAGDGQINGGGYGTVSLKATAKNALTIGAVEDATEWNGIHLDEVEDDLLKFLYGDVAGNTRVLQRAVSTEFSSFGPTGDGRIKPELVANGAGLVSSWLGGQVSYQKISGTSMATPSVTGAALLLHQLYQRHTGDALRASSMKGLLIHTADDLDGVGPDFRTGFGLVNAEAAAQQIIAHATSARGQLISEGALVDGIVDREEFFIEFDGRTPFKATLCWTDPPGAALVHDLDLRVIAPDGTELTPWVLNGDTPTALATRGNNDVDNVEKVEGGIYSGIGKVVITHNGLTQGTQGGLPSRGYGIRELQKALEAAEAQAQAQGEEEPEVVPSQVYSLILNGDRHLGTFAEAIDNGVDEFTMVGDLAELGWAYQNRESFDLQDAAVSPLIGEGQSTGFEAAIQGPVVVHYAVKVSSPSGRARFRLRVDGSIKEELSGEVDWTVKQVMVPSGTHTVRWEYDKSESVNQGADRVWIDQIRITSIPTITSAVSSGSQTVVEWDYERDCAGYTLYYNTSSGLEGARQRTVGESDCREARDPFNPLGGYYAVSVWDRGGGTSILSEWVKAEVLLPAPGFLVATQGDFLDRVELRWGEVPGATDYVITRKIRGGPTRTFVSSARSFIDASLPVGEKADYTVSARNGGTESNPSPSATGFRLDASSFEFSATDGSISERIEIRWPARLAHYRLLRTKKNVDPYDPQVEVVEVPVRQNGFVIDDDVIPGVRYFYWLETRPRDHIVEYNEWTPLGSDRGWAGPAPDLQYKVVSSDEHGGPQFRWIDISKTGEQLLGRQIVTPVSTEVVAGTEWWAADNLIDGSGLSATPTLENYRTVTHADATSENAWLTTSPGWGRDYFLDREEPVIRLGLPSTGFDFVGWDLEELVHWGYPGGAPGHEASFLRISSHNRAGTWNGHSTARARRVYGSEAFNFPLFGLEDAYSLSYTVKDNWDEGHVGGDRVGAGEVRFVGRRSYGFTGGPLECYGRNGERGTAVSAHGYLAAADGPSDENGADSTNACPLPAMPGEGESGTRVLPYHDFLGRSGAVYHAARISNTLPHGAHDETLRVYQWENVILATGGEPFSFQAIQFSESKDWLFQYKAGNPGGGSATIGIQHFDKGKAAVFSCDENSIPTDRDFAILFELSDPDPVIPETNLVTTLIDEGQLALGQGNGNSLRELIAHAPLGEDGKVHISFPAGMAGKTLALNSQITLPGGARPIVIDGSAAPGLVISGERKTRLFELRESRLVLRNLTLAGGMTSTHGGAILSSSSTLESFAILEGVTIRDCVAGRNGGAIASSSRMPYTMINCTLSGNRAGDSGGALFFNAVPAHPHIIRYTTVAHNHAGERGGGMYNFWAGEESGELTGCLFANNTAVLSGPDIQGKAWSEGYNLFGSSAHIAGIGSEDLKNVNPHLGPLADNGGPTMTHALMEASPAIDQAADARGGIFLAADQRGVARGIEGDFDLTYNGPDIGAYEFTPELIVTTEDDTVARDGKTSLRELINYANAAGGGSIRFAPEISTCVLTSHLLVDTEGGITIDGGGHVTISGNKAVRLIEVENGGLSLRDLKLINGKTNGSPGGFGGAIEMHVDTIVAALRCSFTGHQAQSDAGVIYNPAGKITLIDCTLSGNVSGNKGGIIWNSGRLHLEGCTVSGNSGLIGGALFNHDKGRITVLNSTVTDNDARDFGGAIHNEGVVTVESSLVANNPSGDGKQISVNAAVQRGRNVLTGDPMLAPLGDYGGPTKTRPPLLESPALDASFSEPWRRLTSNRDQVTSLANTPPGEEADSVVDGGTSSTFRGYRPGLLAYWNFDDHRNSVGSRDLVGNVDGVFRSGATRSPRPDSYFQAFDGIVNEQRELGDGSDLASTTITQGLVQDGQLRMTQIGTTGTRSSFRIPGPRNAEAGWKATFDFTLSAGANPADGFSFSYGAIPARTTNGPEATGHGQAEEGWGPGVEHISFEVDTWQPAGQSEYGVNISVNDRDQGHTFGRPLLANSTVSGTATITWHPVNGASFQTTGLHTNANFSNVSTAGFVAAADHIFAFSARTGGATETLLIDNVFIEALESGGDYALDLGGAGSQSMLVENAGQFLNEAAEDDAITIAWWQKQNAISNTTSLWAVSPSASGSQRGMSAHLPWGNGTIFYDSAGCCATPSQRLNGGPPAGTNWTQWTHVALVKSGDQKQVWVDGQLALAQGGAAPLPTDFTDLFIGSNASGGESLRGLIDEVAIFKGALTGGEIQDLMVSGVAAPDELALDLTLADGPALPTEMRIFAAPHHLGSDPAAFRLEGSNGGEHFEIIAEGPLGPFAERGDFAAIPMAPKFPYETYRLTLIGATDPSIPGVQIAEVELLRRYESDQRGKPRLADGDGDFRLQRDLGAVEAQSLVVNTIADENDGLADGIASLRDALATEAELIFFDPRVFKGEPADTIVLEHGHLEISGLRSVDAAPLGHRVSISGNDQHRVLAITSGTTAALRGLVVRDGKTFGGVGAADQDGAGIRSFGNLTLIDCVVTDNDAHRIGGGVRAQDSDYLVIRNSTVSNNVARGLAGAGVSVARGTDGFIDGSTISGNVLMRSNVFGGGGILCYGPDSHLRIEHSTIANNRSGKNGGGIQVSDRASLEMIHCTVSDNTGLVGAGLLVDGGAQAQVGNSLVAGNHGANVQGDFTDLGGNLLSGDPRLAPLGDYGGPTQTMMPLWDSPALGAGDNQIGFGFQQDQRGKPRFADRRVDAGAVENGALAFLNVSDLDGDGMGDEWEASYGFDPLDPSDGELDADGDGLENAGEFEARSNPRDPGSSIHLLSFQRQEAGENASKVTVVWTSGAGVTYSLWRSRDLENWSPIPETNIIAVAGITELSVTLPTEAEQFVRVAAGRGDESRPFHASFRNVLTESGAWEPEGLVASGNGQPVTRWQDSIGQDDLLPSGSPLLRENNTPTGEAAVEFRGGDHNDALFSNPGVGNYALKGATSFTVAIAFRPRSDSEVAAGAQWTQKSQLVAADMLGSANDWGLSYGGNSVWFGVGDSAAGDATLQVQAGSAMAQAWWIAVGTWTADNGDGEPRFACWLFDQRGNLVAESGEVDPNTVAESTNRFQLSRANSGIVLGGLRANRNARNLDGVMAAVRLYDVSVDGEGADSLAERLATQFTSDARPE